MPRTSNCPICNPTLTTKFCHLQDKEYGCKEAFGCKTDDYSRCISCPFAMAIIAKYLMDLKELSLGEAFRLCLRQEIEAQKAREILRELLQDKKYYPKRREKKNENR